MRKAMVRSGLAAVLTLCPGAGTLTAAGQTVDKKAEATATPLCAFARKLAAAAGNNELMRFKGEETSEAKESHDEYTGTLVPEKESHCKLQTHRRRDGREIALSYGCVLGPRRIFAEATPIYERGAAELRACFPDWKFDEKRFDIENKGNKSGSLTTEQRGYELRWTLFDEGAMEDALEGKISGKPGVEVALTVFRMEPASARVIPPRAAGAGAKTNAPLRVFIEKVLAAGPGRFASLRGERQPGPLEAYSGLLEPDDQSKCEVIVGVDIYRCTLLRNTDMAGIQPEYERRKTELQAAYPEIEFKEKNEGSAETENEKRTLQGRNDVMSVSLTAEDRIRIIQKWGKAEEKRFPARLTLTIMPWGGQ